VKKYKISSYVCYRDNLPTSVHSYPNNLEVVYLEMVVMEQEFEFGKVEGKHVSIP